LKKVELFSNGDPISTELQTSFIDFVRKHEIVEYSSDWNMECGPTESLFKNLENVNTMKLYSQVQIQTLFTSKTSIKRLLHLEAEDELFIDTTFDAFLTYLEACENLMKEIYISGNCRITEQQWEKLFALIKTKPGTEALALKCVGCQRYLPAMIASLLNENPNINHFSLEGDDVSKSEVHAILEALAPERKFDLNCDFGDLAKKEDFCNMVKPYISRYEWLVVKDIVADVMPQRSSVIEIQNAKETKNPEESNVSSNTKGSSDVKVEVNTVNVKKQPEVKEKPVSENVKSNTSGDVKAKKNFQ